MSDELPPFIKWSDYKSTDEKNPDVLELKVVETETFDTQYSTNVKVQLKIGVQWVPRYLSLKSHDSANGSLLRDWMNGVQKGKIKKGKVVRIKTWLGISKNGRQIRRSPIF